MQVNISSLYRKKKHRQVIDLYESNKSDFDKSSSALLMISGSYANLKLYNNAIAILNTLIHDDFELGKVLPLISFCYSQSGAYRFAIQTGLIALKHNLTSPLAYNSLGIAFMAEKRYGEGIQALLTACELQPNNYDAWANLGNAYVATADYKNAINTLQKAVALSSTDKGACDNLMLAIGYCDHLNDKERDKIRKSLSRFYPPQAKYFQSNWRNDKIKLGFVSGDFRLHAVTFFFLSLLQNINRDEFEIFCYSNSQQRDAFTKKIENLSNKFKKILPSTDKEVAQIINDDKIDVLFDLSGHTAQNRVSVFSYNPAKLNVGWLGYGLPTANPAIKYWLVDNITNPEEECKFSGINLLKLDPIFLSFSCDEAVEINFEKSGKPNDKIFRFGSFNNFSKLSDQTINLWYQILETTQNTQLIIKCKQFNEGGFREKVLQRFARFNTEWERVILRGQLSSYDDHMHFFGSVDVALDPFPYNGTTTTSECLLMGVPVLTLEGNGHLGRVGMSIMLETGLESFVANTKVDYVRIAKDLASGASFPNRFEVREMFLKSAIGNAKLFSKSFENTMKDLMKS